MAAHDRVRGYIDRVRGRTFALAALLLAGCNDATPTYTLYRNSLFDRSARLHWATFEAADKGAGLVPYNQENCELAARVLNENIQRTGNVQARFWCEQGRYRP